MRLGQNPAKFVDHVAQPAKITVAVITYIPFLGGYYHESLAVLKACLGSLWENTDRPHDLMVFDNASCLEARDFLCQAQQQGKIQYLVLSEKNIGKGGGWNFIFSAAPGDIIAYADSDIYFFPGWLSALVETLESVPNIGMVTGMPLWSPEEFSTSTIAWAEKSREVRLERGNFLPWEDYWRHSRSLGKSEAEARAHFQTRQDICVSLMDKRYYVGAGHFQFVARRQVLQTALPIPSDRPMGQVRSLDIALNHQGYLRLSTPDWWVQHLGNTLQGLEQDPAIRNKSAQNGKSPARGWMPSKIIPLRRFLLWLHNKTFDVLYRS